MLSFLLPEIPLRQVSGIQSRMDAASDAASGEAASSEAASGEADPVGATAAAVAAAEQGVGPDAVRADAVEHADDRGIRDLRVREEHCFQHGGCDLVALVLDELLQPVDDVERAVGRHGGDVARVQPAIGIERAPGRLVVAEVALHHLRSAHPQLARRALSLIGDLDIRSALDVDDAAIERTLAAFERFRT